MLKCKMSIKLFVLTCVLRLFVYTTCQHASSVLYESDLSLIQSHVMAGHALSIRLDIDLGLRHITIS